ncbi:MAG: hypothetical protein KAV00_05925, partial [Phycisphaerae bacterium]|nr:hypothetical protein [Phycisphaerae bacterium]
PIKLYFNEHDREQWLRDMVAGGRKKHMLTRDDAEHILSRIKEPFIQKYLQSLAVHLCTLPITQIVSVAVAWIYAATHPELSPLEKTKAVGLILFVFQVTPISPGSLVRGLYVLYLVIRERNIRDYNIAVFLGFFKYIGYLAFPLQMAYRYPALARFMAGHWATEAVHIVPVFGEHGALMEHGVFDLFYNWPLTIRRRMRERAGRRAELRTRIWHIIPIAIVAVALFGVTDIICRNVWGTLPTLKNIWPAAILLPMLLGAATTLGAGGAKMLSRVKLTMVAAAITAAGYTVVHAALASFPALGGGQPGAVEIINNLGIDVLWNLFIFTVVATVAALLTEINLPEAKGI